jgi:acyl-CoA thioester hydrolase
MTQRYTSRFRVRHYELDFYDHLNHAVYVQYMQQAAVEASAAAGFGLDWYRDRGTAWVIRHLAVRYDQSARYGDEVEVHTWVSAMMGVRCLREYDLRRAGDGGPLARARAEWVYIDLASRQPARLPDGVAVAFAPTGEQEDLGVRLRKARPTEDAYRYRGRRRVQFHELDSARHVNHAVYLHWVTQAYFDALRAAGHPLDAAGRADWMVWQGGHEIEYLAPALDNDPIEVVSWVCELARVRGAWTHEVCHAETGQLLARDYSLGVFVDRDGRPAAAPEQAVRDVLRGPPD